MSEPLVFTTTTLPPNHSLTSWLELSLQDQCVLLKVNIMGTSIILLLQDPPFLVQIIKEGMGHAIEGLGLKIWIQIVRHPTQLMKVSMCCQYPTSTILWDIISRVCPSSPPSYISPTPKAQYPSLGCHWSTQYCIPEYELQKKSRNAKSKQRRRGTLINGSITKNTQQLEELLVMLG